MKALYLIRRLFFVALRILTITNLTFEAVKRKKMPNTFSLKKHTNILIASFITAIVLSASHLILITFGALTIDATTFENVAVLKLPLETILYHFLLFVAVLNLYDFLNYKYSGNKLDKYSLSFSNLMIGICFAFGFFGSTKLYTIVVFVPLVAILFLIEYINKTRFMFKFYRAFAVFLIPFWLINFILISKKIYQFDPEDRLKLDIGVIPLENYFNGMNFETPVYSSKDAVINFNWGNGSPNAVVNADEFSAKWTGQIQARYTGAYTFHLTSDNGRRLYINNQI
ncbi:hypothetical protein EON78_03375 [bacterium]|nr:MAG: hypothetical protein EON78_03375 [bacterium]